MRKFANTHMLISLTLLVGLVPNLFFGPIVTATSANAQKSTAPSEQPSHASPTSSTNAKKLSGASLRSCQHKQPDISSTMHQVSAQGVAQLAAIRDIAERTKSLYITNGYSIASYAGVVSDIEALYDNGSMSIKSLTNLSENWSCADNTPAQGILVFRDAKRTQVAALQAYKDKVRTLILLVKQAAAEDRR